MPQLSLRVPQMWGAGTLPMGLWKLVDLYKLLNFATKQNLIKLYHTVGCT